ncbi:MAG: hydrogen gas-evolving membrane-bound hydrogenase subunit E [Selenomonadaceae bacterium]
MRGFVITVLALLTGLFCSSVTYLPVIGDPYSVPNQHITPVYIAQSELDTGSPNIVTGTLADYRGFDTMWETTVMFLSGLTTTLILTSSTMGRRPEKEDEYE